VVATTVDVVGDLAAAVELLPAEDGSARLQSGWLDDETAERLLRALRQEAAWAQEHVRIAGRRLPVPRLTAWHGDRGVAYAYSGIHHRPRPWTPALSEVRTLLERHIGQPFNGVLANLYRDGRDSVGWHSDDEAKLTGACIASVSLGAPRRFALRRVDAHAERVDVVLRSGALLVMDGASQRHWRHSVPKTAETVGPRVNLTFRLLARG
jgi:alkylated DNA repair dioxygenase AlkB